MTANATECYILSPEHNTCNSLHFSAIPVSALFSLVCFTTSMPAHKVSILILLCSDIYIVDTTMLGSLVAK